MRILVRGLGMAAVTAVSLTLGLAGTSQASSTEAHPSIVPTSGFAAEVAPQAAAARCGLSYKGPVFGRYDYTIRNCHSYAVKRQLDIRKPIVGYPDGQCHHIRANSSVSDWTSIPDSAHIDGIKPC